MQNLLKLLLVIECSLNCPRLSVAGEAVRVVAGDSSIIKKLQESKGAVEKKLQISLEVRVNPFDLAMVSLSNGQVDGVFASSPERTFNDAEKKGFKKGKENEYQWLKIFEIPIKLAVNPKNQTNTLGKEQIIGILSGKITSWESINGQKLPIRLFAASIYSAATRGLFRFYLQQEANPKANLVFTVDGLLKAIENDQGAIGIFTGTLESKGFRPKVMLTEAMHPSYFYIKKSAKPDVLKFFNHLKENRLEVR